MLYDRVYDEFQSMHPVPAALASSNLATQSVNFYVGLRSMLMLARIGHLFVHVVVVQNLFICQSGILNKIIFVWLRVTAGKTVVG